MISSSADDATRFLDANAERHLHELFELLRLPSVSALPAHASDMHLAANWLANKLRSLTVPEVSIVETGGHPLVWARWQVSDQQPTVMIYAHYDVQPPDPLELWELAPFAPEIRNGKIYARGAGDDKGGLYATLMSLESMVAVAGQPQVNLIFFFEGEEEIGSPSVAKTVAENVALFKCDYILSADGLMWSESELSLTVATKGMAACQIDLRTASQDTHSGLYGAAIRNAAQAVAELAATFHTADGRVAVTGFYDRVVNPTDVDRAEIGAVPFDETGFFDGVGVRQAWGEPGYETLERIWLRPTVDINGIWSGFQGAGSKTVTPCEAHLKITCRLVPDQDPHEILNLIRIHAEANVPAGATVTVTNQAGTALPFAIDRQNPALVAAGEVLEELGGKPASVIRLGGTLPIAEVFKEQLGAEMVFFAWSLPECNAHAPNEWHRVEDLRTAALATSRLLHLLQR